jgi:cytochrome P450
MLGFFALFLARNPQHRRQLVDDPSLIPNAVEELLRRHGLISNGRRVRSDTSMSGVTLKKGDVVQAPSALYGLDEKITLDALTVDFTRVRPKHITFGGGPHMCPGQQLARRELKVFLEEWLPRVPEFDVDPARPVEMQSGLASTVLSLHLRWTPSRTIP